MMAPEAAVALDPLRAVFACPSVVPDVPVTACPAAVVVTGIQRAAVAVLDVPVALRAAGVSARAAPWVVPSASIRDQSHDHGPFATIADPAVTLPGHGR